MSWSLGRGHTQRRESEVCRQMGQIRGACESADLDRVECLRREHMPLPERVSQNALGTTIV